MISAGALPQTPLGELTALPRPLSWIKGSLLLWGRGGERGNRREKGRGEGNGRAQWEGKGKGRERNGRGMGGERGRVGERKSSSPIFTSR